MGRSPLNFSWMSTDGQGTKCRLSRVQERYRLTTDGRATAYSELSDKIRWLGWQYAPVLRNRRRTAWYLLPVPGGRPYHNNGQAIIFGSCRYYLSSSFFFFPRLFSAVGDWMSTIYFHTLCGLSTNLECRSEMCCDAHVVID